ncbi:MAG TPA: hypothetical protein PKE27_00165 [Povalibacter sp.]|uniref:P-loop NTPase n=1 Tax=Povalibacter sp. TaxID=1962978 RepID=UPI002CCF8A62|nr:P-loop NTPase [Povalibacter sp.]HMN42960.1 hypothetical protein [Povalibacter sp.]
MSLVERALKKLQESRAITDAKSHQTSVPAARIINAQPSGSVVIRGMPTPENLPVPRRTLHIDRDILRDMQLLAPVDCERAIASQYQQVKRPLISSAQGKSGASIPSAHLIMLTSALPGEGKTFTSINLSLSMALEKDVEILLVDADVAKPHVSRLFGLYEEPGLLDLLVDSSLHAESLILPTDVPGLSMLSAGKPMNTATELLASERMTQVVTQLGKPGRIVLFDSPPLLLSTESRALVHHIGQVVLVVRADVTPQRAVLDAIDIIGTDKPVSLILNQANTPPSSGYYGYGSYGDVGGAPAAS